MLTWRLLTLCPLQRQSDTLKVMIDTVILSGGSEVLDSKGEIVHELHGNELPGAVSKTQRYVGGTAVIMLVHIGYSSVSIVSSVSCFSRLFVIKYNIG